MPDVLALYFLTATLAAQTAPDIMAAVHKRHATGRRATTPSIPETPNA